MPLSFDPTWLVMHHRAALIWITIMAATGMILRVWSINAHSFWLDESYSWTMATKFSFSEIVQRTVNDFNPPLYYMILKCWSAANGIHIHWSIETRMYSMATLFSVVSGWLLLRGLESPQRRWIPRTWLDLLMHENKSLGQRDSAAALTVSLISLLVLGCFAWKARNRGAMLVLIMIGSTIVCSAVVSLVSLPIITSRHYLTACAYFFVAVAYLLMTVLPREISKAVAALLIVNMQQFPAIESGVGVGCLI